MRVHDERPWSPNEAGYRALLANEPLHGQALDALAREALQQARHSEATLWLRALVAVAPGRSQARIDLARTLHEQGLDEEAAEHFARAVELEPGNAQVRLMAKLHQGAALDQAGRPAEALQCYADATHAFPAAADAWAALGVTQRHLGRTSEAEQSFRRALQLDATRIDVIELFGLTLQDQRQYHAAALVFERLLLLAPRRALAAGRLMHCKMLVADWTALDVLQQHVHEGLAAGELSAEPFGLQAYCASPELLSLAARKFAATYFPDRSALLPAPRVGSGPKLRIGYVAGEFRQQATALLLAEVLEHHDKERFEIFAFDNGRGDDSALRRRIEAATTLVPIRELSHLDAAAAVRDRGIDILVNLNGYFGQARQQLFSLRPAAIQVNYLGFPGTIGAPYIDYLIADSTVVPPESRRFYTEQVVYLPDSYQPNDSSRRIAPEPATRSACGLPDGAFVFCCLNNAYKITPPVFTVWMRLLQRMPHAVLLLLANAEETRSNLRHEAQERGVSPDRVLFAPTLPHPQHLRRLSLCDLFLDTWPYGAHTTGSDALWAGLPLLTCTGPTFPSRVAASLLKAVGLPELVTDSLAEYEALAFLLATEPGRLANLRARLAALLPNAALYNTPRYTRHLEAAYQHLAERARTGMPASAFAVDAVA